MPSPGEHKTVQACVLAYAQEIGWTLVPREEAEQWREVFTNCSTSLCQIKGGCGKA